MPYSYGAIGRSFESTVAPKRLRAHRPLVIKHMQLLADVYLLDDLMARQQWRMALLLVALAGVALLFMRSWVARIAGVLFISARLVAMPIKSGVKDRVSSR